MFNLALGRGALLVALVLPFAGCGFVDYVRFGAADNPPPAIELLAVLPLRELPEQSGEEDPGERPVLATHGGRAVTAQIYGFLAKQTRFRFVPDLTVAGLVGAYKDPLGAARELAKATGADAVIFGTVYRFRERIGTKYAAAYPASVSFDLGLYIVALDEVTWKGSFDETQEALSSNLFKAWMFWEAGPHWFTARELTGLGTDKLLEEMVDTIPDD